MSLRGFSAVEFWDECDGGSTYTRSWGYERGGNYYTVAMEVYSDDPEWFLETYENIDGHCGEWLGKIERVTPKPKPDTTKLVCLGYRELTNKNEDMKWLSA